MLHNGLPTIKHLKIEFHTFLFRPFFFLSHPTDKQGERFCSILTAALTANTWKVQVVILAAIKSFIARSVQNDVLSCRKGRVKCLNIFVLEWTGLVGLRMAEEKKASRE